MESGGGGQVHVMMFPYFAFGHISPFVHLARNLVAAADGGIRVSILTPPANIDRIATLLPASPPSITLVPLPLPYVEGLPPELQSTADATPAMSHLLMRANDLAAGQLPSLLARHRPDLILHDFAQPWLAGVANPLGIKTVFFSVFAAVSTAYLTVPSRRGEEDIPSLSSPPDDFPATSSIKSVPPYQAADFKYVFTSFEGMPTVYSRVGGGIEAAAAIVVKSCMELEGPYIDYVKKQYKKPVILAGPVVPEAAQPPPAGEMDDEWSQWLGRFSEGSVVLCSFGSETFLTETAVRELMLGLETSGMPFLAVLNFPGGGMEEVRRRLPEGLEERVEGEGVGRVRCGWMPQQRVLNHPSVGYWVCHAGLSSVVEGLVAGCRLVLLPQRGDQYLNAAMFAGDHGVGVVVERDPDNGSFTRKAVCIALKEAAAGAREGGGGKEKERKLREFLMDREAQGKFMVEMVKSLHDLAVTPPLI